MRRIRWFDPEFGEPSTPIGWPAASLILATVFLNFIFVEVLAGRFWPARPLPVYWTLLLLVGLGPAILFFAGPAMSVQASGRSIFAVMGDELGVIPAVSVRVCCIVFLPLWMGSQLTGLLRYLIWFWSGRAHSAIGGALVCALVALVFSTAHQRPRTLARMALFTCKLFLAITIAAFIRVHDGWPMRYWHWADNSGQVRFGFSDVAQYSAPLALLAASLMRRSTRKEVLLTGLAGMTLPLFLAAAISGFIAVVTHASSLYRPSLTPTLAMALWSQVASRAAPPRMIIAAITLLGALRFAARFATTAAGMPEVPTRRSWAIAACMVAATTACCLVGWNPTLGGILDWSGRCLGVTSAVVTAGFLTGRRALLGQRRIDWVGAGSLIAGLGAPLYIRQEEWLPWLLPSYVVGLAVCLCGRLAEKLLASRPQLRQN
jgi:hypothetical protein